MMHFNAVVRALLSAVVLSFISLNANAFDWTFGMGGNGIPTDVEKTIISKLVLELNTSRDFKYHSGSKLQQYVKPECSQSMTGDEICVYRTMLRHNVVFKKTIDLRRDWNGWIAQPGDIKENLVHSIAIVLTVDDQNILLWHDGYAGTMVDFMSYDSVMKEYKQEVADGGKMPEADKNRLVAQYYTEKAEVGRFLNE